MSQHLKHINLKVEADHPGRLDKYICENMSDLSRNKVQNLIKKGKILINQQTAKASTQVKKGDLITIQIYEEKSNLIQPKNIPLEIIFQNNNFAVINKPAGLVVHPSETRQKNEITLINALKYHFKKLSDLAGTDRPGIVHRLDKDTSGALLIAKNNQTHQKLSQIIKNRAIKKVYIALIKGILEEKKGIIDAPISRSYLDRKKMAVSNKISAKNALTRFKVLNTFKGSTLVEIELITGRTHQIRVHFGAIKHPVIGDNLYGDRTLNQTFKEKYNLERPFLHAFRIELIPPGYKKIQIYTAKIPKELISIRKELETQ